MKKITSFFLVFTMLATLWGVGEALMPEPRSADAQNLEQRLRDQQRRIQELERQEEAQRRALRETAQEVHTFQGSVANLNAEISHLESQIAVRQEQINQKRLEIEKLEAEIKEKEEEIEVSREQLGRLILEIYRNDEETLIDLVFKYDTFSEFFNQAEARESLNNAVNERLEGLNTIREQLEESASEVIARNKELEEARNELQQQRNAIASKRAEEQRILSQARQREAEQEATLARIDAAQREARQEAERLARELAARQSGGGGGPLSWPMDMSPPNVYISQPYGCIQTSWARAAYPSCNGGAGGYHNGLDIRTGGNANPNVPPNYNAYSAESGRVIFSGFHSAWGHFIQIAHDNGLVTLYAHLGRRGVSEGQRVQRGQAVGVVGSTGFSTGEHLHFTVYQNGSSTNPMQFLR